MKQKTQFSIWLTNYLLAPFSWSKWVDISTFDFAGPGYLLQGKVNKRTNAKQFRITSMKQTLALVYTNETMERLNKCGLIDEQVKFNS